jgi:hypothetical protein
MYKLLKTNIDGVKIYAKIDDDNISRQSCTEQDPEYLKWVSEGNTPTPADEGTQ